MNQAKLITKLLNLWLTWRAFRHPVPTTPLKYLYYNTAKECERIFPFLAWAGYLPDWPGPEKGERPSAYIIILGDKSISDIFGVDHGIAAHCILLGATDAGLGGCIIGSIKRDELSNELSIPDNLRFF